MTSAHGDRTLRHCHHCGRALRDTMHTRSAYAVDFYSLHTGETEPVHLTVGEEGETITVLRLLRPYEVFTCIECYRKAEVREERERLFRPELAQGVGPPPSRPAQP